MITPQKYEQQLTTVAKESLDVFKEVADKATDNLAQRNVEGDTSLMSINTFTDNKGAEFLNKSSSSIRVQERLLEIEPVLARIVIRSDDEEERTIYFARKGNMPLSGVIEHSNFGAPIGRYASLNIGEGEKLEANGVYYELIEKSEYKPKKNNDVWDSINTIFHIGNQPYSIPSLLGFLGHKNSQDVELTLDDFLTETHSSEIILGREHEVQASMALRDQPILDKFQDKIFRLPIDSQLLIIGPPGTGKTTTLIRRLGQKINIDNLSDYEKAKIGREQLNNGDHAKSWLMFTPTDLLKSFVKEAFNREQIPAPDQNIKTWASYRKDIARNVLGILSSPNSKGPFILKQSLKCLSSDVEEFSIQWFEEFESFHQNRIIEQLQLGHTLLLTLTADDNAFIIKQLTKTMSTSTSDLVNLYRNIDSLEKVISPFLKLQKINSDREIKACLTLTYNKNKNFIDELAGFIDSLQFGTDDEIDVDDEFNDDEIDNESIGTTSRLTAVKIYNQTIRSLSRYKFLKRTVPKNSRASKVCDWLGDRMPKEELLLSIGNSIAIQNGLRRFLNPSRRYISDVAASYRDFRKTQVKKNSTWYATANIENNKHIEFMELDVIILLMLKNTRVLMSQPFVSRQFDLPKFSLLNLISGHFKNQILIDEATDFSPIQLSCMKALTSLHTGSFFACGDFNQRVTQIGIRSYEQIKWVSSKINKEEINIVYRQSKKLNEFSQELLSLLGGKMENRGITQGNVNHVGVSPVLLEYGDSLEKTASWLDKRIHEIEQMVKITPTIAVLVNTEAEVEPMASALNEVLEERNLQAIACKDGRVLGEGTDVRVFDVQHIKGLEFEAVFFVGIDSLKANNPGLFGSYLYVGATRAATYFGVTSNGGLPESLQKISSLFIEDWA